MKRRLLFVCATLGVHSPMAEALLHRIDSVNFKASCACTMTRQVHPLAVDVMREVGVDLTQMTLKSVADFRDESFDHVITMDETTKKQRYSIVTGDTLPWNFDDPALLTGDVEWQRRAFRAVRDQIAQRLRLFVIVNVRQTFASERTQVAGHRGGLGVRPAR